MDKQPVIFHFNCPLCGAHPNSIPITEYLERWRLCSKDCFDALLKLYGRALKDVRFGNSHWLTKKFSQWIDRIITELPATNIQEPLNQKMGTKTKFLFDCSFCNTLRGARKHDNYFTIWEEACKVQTANLLYEFGIVSFCVARQLPKWASPKKMGRLGGLLALNQKALGAMGLMECGFCGRWTNCLYGDGTRSNPHRCRWCTDRAKTMGIRLIFSDDQTIRAKAIMAELPEKILEDIVPGTIKLERPKKVIRKIQ